MISDRNWKQHESWGMVGLSRVTFAGSRQLFGSDITNHTAILLRIKHAKKSRELGRDWTMGEDLICEIMLSPNQFADLICNMNVGDGVPCTITFTAQDGNIEYQPEDNKLVVIEAERMENDAQMMQQLSNSIMHIQELVSHKKMPKGEGQSIVRELKSLYKYISDGGSDFLRNQAKKEIANMVTEAKSQVSDFINNKIYSVGLETLIDASTVTPELLESGDNDNEF